MSKNDSKLVTKVSPLIEGQVPDFVQSDHPVFVRFLKHYYQYLEAGRITLDTDVNCERIYSIKNCFKTGNTTKIKILDDRKIILELKTSNKYSKYDATKFFKHRDTRMSKYCEV